MRYRQVLISMGRQNGKSILGAIFGVYGLLFHEYAPKVIGVAYSAKTAEVVYNRVGYTISNVPQFSKVCKVTKTQGIKRSDKPGEYIIKPNSEKAVQGFPITLCIYDEVHITSEKLWSAAKQGTKTKADGLVLGITTAGDDNSTLLKALYTQGDEAIAGRDERFGFFLWEAPEGSNLETPGAIEAANPAVACGRVPVARVRSDAKSDPEPEQQRYVLNRFISAMNSWLPMHLWNQAPTAPVESKAGGVVFAIDRSPSWEHATITANQDVDGQIRTEVVASIVKPTLDQLVNICVQLARFMPTFAMDSYQLGDLAAELKRRGMKVSTYSQANTINACSTAYALIAQGKVAHQHEQLLAIQMPRAVRKNVGDAWKISRKDSSIEIDAVMATVIGIHAASTLQREELQFYI